ncbi:MAG: VOC family protein [Polyangiaceae bacterium]|jgi:predicted enzyme related to lactoylglutathione lyase|nr:VOC family protein [Polyangiaceae bacterium]MBK8942541.1 VOC family protein [Polyangiaceae bacterium]
MSISPGLDRRLVVPAKNTEAIMSDKVKAGRFVWFELNARDVEAAKGFYGELFGWKAKSIDMGPMGTYTMLTAGTEEVGGIAKLEGKGDPGWLSYATVDDVDAAVATAVKHGAKVQGPAVDYPGVGRFAVLADGQGARFAVIKGDQPKPEPTGKPALGTVCWTELVTQDPSQARALYTSVFGWSTEDKDMGPMGTYTVLKRGDVMAAGIMKAMDARAPSMWLNYVLVEDVEASFERAKRLKAVELVPPADIPGIGRFAVVADPQGSAIALFKG